MNEIPISARDLLALNAPAAYAYAKDFSKTSFWQYTRLTTADLILSSCSFRVSNLNGMNDLDEARHHEKERERVFALCFCNSNTEKIPMWYLYSGLTGKGAALGLTPSVMLNWLESIKTVRGVRSGQSKEEGTLLEIGPAVEMRYGWVYYQKPKEPQNIMYRNKWYYVNNAAKFQKDNYFIKSYPWEYEKEFRLVFINHTPEDYDALFVDIPPELQKAFKVKLAPEFREEQFKKYKNLKCIGPARTHRPIYSNLAIRMNLMSRNRDGLLEYLREELAKKEPGLEAESPCAVIREAGRCEKTADEPDGTKEGDKT